MSKQKSNQETRARRGLGAVKASACAARDAIEVWSHPSQPHAEKPVDALELTRTMHRSESYKEQGAGPRFALGSSIKGKPNIRDTRGN